MASGFDLECPICLEGFDIQKPKILPCAHRVCGRCVLTLLEKGGAQSGCPLCRVPIIADPFRGQRHLAKEVDSLPTDLATVAIVACQETLTGPNVCSCSKEASSICLQCSVKFCTVCAKHHVKKGANPKHLIEELRGLTAEQLAPHCQQICSNGTHRKVSLTHYCTRHDQFVCDECNFCRTSCQKKIKKISDVARVKRKEMRRQVEILAEKEDDLIDQSKWISTVLDFRRDSLLFQSYKVFVGKVQTVLTTNKHMAEQLVVYTSDVVLLQMAESMRKRLRMKTLLSKGKRNRLRQIDEDVKLFLCHVSCSCLGF